MSSAGGRHRSLSRAALVFMGAAATGAGAACDHESSGPVAVYGPTPMNVDGGDPGASVTGTPPPPPTADAGSNMAPTTSDAGRDSQKEVAPTPEPPRHAPVPLYGVPPIRHR